jgi:hypothetical protein
MTGPPFHGIVSAHRLGVCFMSKIHVMHNHQIKKTIAVEI